MENFKTTNNSLPTSTSTSVSLKDQKTVKEKDNLGNALPKETRDKQLRGDLLRILIGSWEASHREY
jgi:hypothetical protein